METFKYLLFVAPLLAALTGCGDIPYSSGSDSAKSPPPGDPGPPPKTVFASVSGVVDIGNPVSGARVSVHTFENAKIGRELGNSTTDANGIFKIGVSERFEGPCLLVSEGGEYVEPSTQMSTKITDKQILSAPITGIKVENEIAINAWTTWAAARTQATRTSFKSDKAAILTNLSSMSKHLKKDAEDEAILNVKPVNIFINGVRPDDFNVLLLLSQQGLSALAEEIYDVSMAQLVLILAEDLMDGVFNDSEATRSRLVLNIHETLQKIQTAPKTSKTKTLHFNPQVFLNNDGFFETLSLDQNPLLYSKEDVPTHPVDVLKRPMLYKLVVEDAAKLKANVDSIVISAEVKSPRLITQIRASLIELKKTINCELPFETELLAVGFPIEKLKTCNVLKEVERVLDDPIFLSVKNGRAHGKFQAQPGDLKQEISYKVSVVAKHKSGNELTFPPVPFSPIPDAAPSSKKEELFIRAISENNEDVALEFIIQGINVMAQTKTGNTPLKAAVLAENSKILRGLVWAGVDLDAKDEAGRTAMDYARENGKQDALILIQNMLSNETESRVDREKLMVPNVKKISQQKCVELQRTPFITQCINKKELDELRALHVAALCIGEKSPFFVKCEELSN